MTRPRAVGLAIFVIALFYIALSTKFWTGFESQTVNSPDNKYWAATYNRSQFLFPFWRSTFVLIPSQGDLNSHEVFRTAGLRQVVHLRWIDNGRLEIVCNHCSAQKLELQRVDSINVNLKVE